MYLVVAEEVSAALGYASVGSLRWGGVCAWAGGAGRGEDVMQAPASLPDRRAPPVAASACVLLSGPSLPPCRRHCLPPTAPPPHPTACPPARPRSEVRKMLIGRLMCERYTTHLGLDKHLVMGKSIMGGWAWLWGGADAWGLCRGGGMQRYQP